MREFDRLVEIMRRLRGPHGCPWDRQQDHHSLKRYLLEEVYEAIEAIDDEDYGRLCGELGDVLLQVVFHAQLAAEEGYFDIRDVLTRINDKLVRRHPHVFGDVTVRDADEVLDNWEHIKRGEADNRDRKSVLDGVPRALPALQRAQKIQQKAAKVGFDWPDASGPWAKIREEIEELERAAKSGDKVDAGRELGDLLFAVVNLARFLHVDAEDCLRQAVQRFERRFQAMEEKARRAGQALEDMTLADMDELWEAVKQDGGETQSA